MTVNDINVDAKFQLRALRDDYIHAFVTYFIAEFTACSQKTAISTGRVTFETERRSPSASLLAPGAGYTHWKQTVFYFPDYATIKRDEVLGGTFSCKVNLENTVGAFARVTPCRLNLASVCSLEKARLRHRFSIQRANILVGQ